MSDTPLLLIEDDPDLRRLLREGLSREGFDVRSAATGRDGLAAAAAAAPEILVVDVGLPDADGRDVCQALRARGLEAPVLFLTARDAVVDRIAGFNAGGDDYLTKPFAFSELVVRLRSLLKRAGAGRGHLVGSLHLDPMTHAITGGGEKVALTPTEFRLLATLAARPGDAVRRRDLLAAGWPDGAIVHDNTLDVYVAKLRRKLAALPGETSIETVRGVGYSLR